MSRRLVRDLEAARACRCVRCGADLLRQADATLACVECDQRARERIAARVLMTGIADASHYEPLRIVT